MVVITCAMNQLYAGQIVLPPSPWQPRGQMKNVCNKEVRGTGNEVKKERVTQK